MDRSEFMWWRLCHVIVDGESSYGGRFWLVLVSPAARSFQFREKSRDFSIEIPFISEIILHNSFSY